MTGDIFMKSVQISDLEDVVLLPPSQSVNGCLCGNPLWLIPKSWAHARQNVPSDIFSFGIVMIYVILNYTIFWVGDSD